jgi:multidrug resistance efflux pump
MKLKFNNHNVPQQQISPIQAENRSGRPNSTPLFSSLLIALVIAVVFFLLYRWYTFGNISAYAVVTGKIMEVRSPCQGEIRDFSLRLGDRVAAGDKACVIVPTEFEKQRYQRDQALKVWTTVGQQTLDSWRATGRVPGTPAAVAAVADPTDAELTGLGVKRAERVLDEKKAILTRTKLLRQADAATEADVRTAALELELAEFNLGQAKAMDDGTRRKLGLPTASAAAGAAPELLPPLPPLDLPPASIELKSAIPGLVIDVAVADGEVVAANQKVLKILESGTLWIDAYVSPEQIQRIEEGDAVRIHLAGEEGTVPGHVVSCARVANPLPTVLERRVKGVDNVCRVRIELDNDGSRLDCGSVIRVVIKSSQSGFGNFVKTLRR